MVDTVNAPEVAKVSSTAVVDIRGLSKVYTLMLGKEIAAVTDLTLSIERGELYRKGWGGVQVLFKKDKSLPAHYLMSRCVW